MLRVAQKHSGDEFDTKCRKTLNSPDISTTHEYKTSSRRAQAGIPNLNKGIGVGRTFFQVRTQHGPTFFVQIRFSILRAVLE